VSTADLEGSAFARCSPRPWAIDGGLASELEAAGHDLTGALWSARLLRDDPGAIVEVHRAYSEAGAVVAISASYQASRAGFAAAGLDAEEADVLLARSVALAREARDSSAAVRGDRPLLVAASVGPYGAIRHDGSEYRGRYGLSHVELRGLPPRAPRRASSRPAGPARRGDVPDLDECRGLVEVLGDHPGMPAGSRCRAPTASTSTPGRACADAAVAASAPSVLRSVNCTPPSTSTRAGGAGRGAADAGRPDWRCWPTQRRAHLGRGRRVLAG
jgi:S-methylmethionine-dependent homocysteine/selenocysteine methylase